MYNDPYTIHRPLSPNLTRNLLGRFGGVSHDFIQLPVSGTSSEDWASSM